MKSRFPSIPSTAVMVTHAHYDHTGGRAEFFDRGARAIAAHQIRDFVARIGLKSGESPRARRAITLVADTLAVGSGDSRFVLYTVSTLHARGMIVAWFPVHRLLIESDLVGLASPTEHRALVAFVKSRGLGVERIAGVHGPVMEWKKFVDGVK